MHKSVSLTEAPSDEDQHQNQMESGCKGVECEYDLISVIIVSVYQVV